MSNGTTEFGRESSEYISESESCGTPGISYGIRPALATIRKHWKAYVALNVFYYCLVLVGMLIALLVPQAQNAIWRSIEQSLHSGFMRYVAEAYVNGFVLKAIALTFLVNFLIGSIPCINLPSMIIPFIGFLVCVLRALIWGILFCPASDRIVAAMIPHYLTLLMEGQGYILALFAAYLQGISFLNPRKMGVRTHGEGYLLGLKYTLQIYILVALTLFISAVYESIEVIYIVTPLAPGH